MNACLSLIHKKQDAVIYYLGIEKYPLSRQEWEILNYFHQEESHPSLWEKIHTCPWETWNFISAGFHLCKKQCDFNEFSLPGGQDLIYFDAFAPDAQPELWSFENFRKLYMCLNPGGILVTYSVKGTVRRAMADAGFSIEKLPGPPGKRQMLRAFK